MRAFPVLTLVLSAAIGATIGVITVEIEKLDKRIKLHEAGHLAVQTLYEMQHEREVE